MTATVKLRGKVNFPTTVTAEGGFQIVKLNGVWTLSPKWTDLTLETTIPDAAGRQLWTLDPVNNVYTRLSVQALIDNLPAGPEGDQGPVGPSPGIHQAYSTTTTDADPGAGVFRLNNATPASATAAYLDNADVAGATVSGIFDRWDDSTNTVKGSLRAEKSGDASVWGEWNVTGPVVDGTGYRKLTLASGAGSGTFTNADVFAITFTRAGDKGADGAGTGDVNGPAASIDSEVALFNSTTGKLIKRASISGLAKLTSGVLSAAAAGTDYLAPAAIGTTVQAYDATIVNAAAIANTKIDAIEFVIDGGGATITTGVKGYLEIPYACTITRSTLLADQSGSIVVDIFKDSYANYPPVVGDKITASAPPTISAATKAQDSTLTGWTTSIAAGDILAFNVNSITTCQRVTISLRVTKT